MIVCSHDPVNKPTVQEIFFYKHIVRIFFFFFCCYYEPSLTYTVYLTWEAVFISLGTSGFAYVCLSGSPIRAMSKIQFLSNWEHLDLCCLISMQLPSCCASASTFAESMLCSGLNTRQTGK